MRLGALVGALLCFTQIACAEDEVRTPFGVRDWIETPRLLYPNFSEGTGLEWSEDGSRFLLMTVRGDLARNGNWVDFYSASKAQLKASTGPLRPVLSLFTGDHRWLPLRKDGYRWLRDNRRIAFTWNDGGSSKILVLDLSNGQVEEKIPHPMEIQTFDITPDGVTVAFVAARVAADAHDRFRDLIANGFAIPDGVTSIHSLLSGYPDEASQGYYTRELFVVTASKAPIRAALDVDAFALTRPHLSPDGRWVALWAPPRGNIENWQGYENKEVQRAASQARIAGESAYQYLIGQLWLVDAHNGAARTLWNAPLSAVQLQMQWRSDGAGLTFWPAFFPLDRGGAEGRAGRAAAYFQLHSGKVMEAAAPQAKRSSQGDFVQLEQGMNRSARLVTAGSTKQPRRLLIDVNPNLADRFSLGRVEEVHWRDKRGSSWSGRLYHPAGEISQRRYPLVISTRSHVPKSAQFSTSGGLGAATATDLGQMLAGRGIAMLIMAFPDDPGVIHMGTPEEKPLVMEGYESAVEHLVGGGWVDDTRVGLAGFSRTGSYVEFAISHSSITFAAAIAVDNVNHGYLSYVAGHDFARADAEAQNGGPAVGTTLQQWFASTAGFNANRIATPLRLERYTGGIAGVLGSWELFSQLRYLGKPVELYVIPDIDKGAAHSLELPNQQLASLDGALDWFDFWLNGHEEAGPSKTQQYQRWRRLRQQQSPLPALSAAAVSGRRLEGHSAKGF